MKPRIIADHEIGIQITLDKFVKKGEFFETPGNAGMNVGDTLVVSVIRAGKKKPEEVFRWKLTELQEEAAPARKTAPAKEKNMNGKIKVGDQVMTPRFLTVRIAHVFTSSATAAKRGFTETTHYQGPRYEIRGKHIGENLMKFAAIEK